MGVSTISLIYRYCIFTLWGHVAPYWKEIVTSVVHWSATYFLASVWTRIQIVKGILTLTCCFGDTVYYDLMKRNESITALVQNKFFFDMIVKRMHRVLPKLKTPFQYHSWFWSYIHYKIARYKRNCIQYWTRRILKSISWHVIHSVWGHTQLMCKQLIS